MPDYLQIANVGLVGCLVLFIWQLPAIIREVTAYLTKRAEARDQAEQRREKVREDEVRLVQEARAHELDKLAEVFRADREKILDTFKEELRFERQEASKQFELLMAAVDKRVCGFIEHHRHPTLVTPLGTTDMAHMAQGSTKGPDL